MYKWSPKLSIDHIDPIDHITLYIAINMAITINIVDG